MSHLLFPLVLRSVSQLRFLSRSGKSAVTPCAYLPIGEAFWAMLIILTRVFPGESFDSRGGTHRVRRFMRARRQKTQVLSVGVRYVPTAASHPLLMIMGKEASIQKQATWGLSSSRSDEVFWCQTNCLGLSHGLVGQPPKRAAKPQFWYTGPDARTESQSSRLNQRFQLLFQHQHIVRTPPLPSPGLARKTSQYGGLAF